MSEYTLQQKQAIESIKTNTAVVAGAGSGKTSVLVERYIGLLQAGFDCRRILAITFTNKAAGEMAERIRQEMSRQTDMAKGERKNFWLEQKNVLSAAYIGTIHGLCTSIIRTNPLQADVEPDTAVLDETEAMLFAESTVRSTLHELLKNNDTSIKILCTEYGYSRIFHQLENFLSEFTPEQVEQEDFAQQLSQGHKNAVKSIAKSKKAFWQELLFLLAGINELNDNAHRAALESIAANLWQIEQALTCLPDDLGKLEILSVYIDPLSARSRDGEQVKLVKECKQKLAQNCYDSKALAFLPHWTKIIKKCVLNFSEEKRKRGVLTFADLEHTAFKVLSGDALLRAGYAQKYNHIMVDEFQDTNELQKSIVYLLAGEDNTRLKNHKLFVVGDDKQSIYRFRGADVNVFGRVRSDIKEGGGQEIELMDNFRSTEKILAVCNDLFSVLMGEGSIKYLPLRAGKNVEVEDTSPVEILLVEREKNHLTEAQAVAARLKRLNVEEQISFSQMAVLLRAKTNIGSYINAFEEQGIPYNVLDGQGFFAVPEVVDILNVLRFLDNSLRDASLLGVLRSPLFALDDETITNIALCSKENSLWQKIMNFSGILAGEQRENFLRAQVILHELLQAASIYSLGALLRMVIDKLKVMQLMLLYSDAKQRYANLEKLVDIVFAFEYEKNGGLSEFIAHVAKLLQKEAREGLEQIESELSDAVKLLTIHKAKGLQFKVVAVAECASSFYSERDAVFYDKKTGLAIKVRNTEGLLEQTEYFSTLRELDKKANNEEMKRLLYVAMTRAEEKLILSGVHDKNQKKETWLNWVLRVFEEQENFLQGATSRIVKASCDEKFICQSAIPDKTKKECAFYDLKELLPKALPLTDSSKTFTFSATALNDYRHCQKLFYYKYLLALPEFIDSKRGEGKGDELAPNIIGIIVHDVLRSAGTLPLPVALAAAVDKYVQADDKARYKEKNIKPWLQAYLEGSLFTELNEQKNLSEFSFNLPLFTYADKQFCFSGSIDKLVFTQTGGMEIIDFKTDKETAGKLEEYGMQLAIYALAAEYLHTDKKVESAKLHFVRLNESLVLSVKKELPALTKEIQTLCEEISGKIAEEEFTCDSAWCKFCAYSYVCPYCAE